MHSPGLLVPYFCKSNRTSHTVQSQVLNRNSAQVCLNQERGTRHSIWMWTFPPLPVWQTIRARNWPLASRIHLLTPAKNNPSKPPPARIERWRLQLQEYDFVVVYRPGPINLADPLSRLPTKQTRNNMEACADKYFHYLAEQLAPRAMSIDEIREAGADRGLKVPDHQSTIQVATILQNCSRRTLHHR